MKYQDIPHDELIRMINEYTRISRERDLTEEEASDRQELRQEYLRRIRVNMSGQLDYVVRIDGDEDASDCKEDN